MKCAFYEPTFPQGLKPIDFLSFMYGLKPVPFKSPYPSNRLHQRFPKVCSQNISGRVAVHLQGLKSSDSRAMFGTTKVVPCCKAGF
jgi:hypothetical protein